MKNTLSRLVWSDILRSTVVTLLLSAASFVIFVKFGYEVLEKETQHFDLGIELVVYSWRTPFWTEIMKLISYLGSEVAFGGAILLSIFLYYQKRVRTSVFVLCVVMGGFAFNYILKLLFKVPRPTISQLVYESTYSFPSGHAMGSFIFYLVLAYLLALSIDSRWGKVFVFSSAAVIILLIGFSRIYLGVHNPSDIIGSYIVGICWLLGSYTIIRKISPRR